MSGSGEGASGEEGLVPALPVELDLLGLKCPLPALRTRKALGALPPGGRLKVVCSDPMTVIDIPHVAQETGARVEERIIAEDRLTFILAKPA